MDSGELRDKETAKYIALGVFALAAAWAILGLLGGIDAMINWTLGLIGMIAKVAVGMTACFVMMRQFDNRNGVNFKRDVYPKILSSPEAAADYHRGRLIFTGLVALGVLIGSI